VLTPRGQADGQHLKTHFSSRLCEGMVGTGIKLQSFYQVERTTSVPSDGGRNWTPQSVSPYLCGTVDQPSIYQILIGRDPWTQAEDLKLLEALGKHEKRWNVISGCIKGRPAVQCRNRFLSLQRAGKVSEDGKSSVSTTASCGPISDAEIIQVKFTRHTNWTTFH